MYSVSKETLQAQEDVQPTGVDSTSKQQRQNGTDFRNIVQNTNDIYATPQKKKVPKHQYVNTSAPNNINTDTQEGYYDHLALRTRQISNQGKKDESEYSTMGSTYDTFSNVNPEEQKQDIYDHANANNLRTLSGNDSAAMYSTANRTTNVQQEDSMYSTAQTRTKKSERRTEL